MDVRDLLQVLEADEATIKDKLAAYTNYTTILKDDSKKDSLQNISKILPDLLPIILAHVRDETVANKELQLAALKVLGYLVHSTFLSRSYTKNQMHEVLSTIATLIISTAHKNACNLGIWIITVQVFPKDAMMYHPDDNSQEGEIVFDKVFDAIANYALNANKLKFDSTTIQLEALAALGRLLTQVPEEMMKAKKVEIWVPLVYNRLFSELPKIRERSEQNLKLCLSIMKQSSSNLSARLVEDINSHLLNEMLAQVEGVNKDPYVVRCWGYLIQLLGPRLFEHDLINTMLKIPERTFVHHAAPMRLTTYHNWKYLINSFSQHQGELTANKRIKLLLTPFLGCINQETHVGVRQACFFGWVHLMESIGSVGMSQVFDRCVPPFVDMLLQSVDSDAELRCFAYDFIAQILLPENSKQQESHSLASLQNNKETNSVNVLISIDDEVVFTKLTFFLKLFKDGVNPNNEEKLWKSIKTLWCNLMERLGILLNSEEANAKKYSPTVTLVLRTLSSLSSPPLAWFKSLFEPLLSNFTLNVLVSSSYEIDQVVPLVFLIQLWMNLKTEEIDLYLETINLLIGILHGKELLARVNVGTLVMSNFFRHVAKILENKVGTSTFIQDQILFLQLWTICADSLQKFITISNTISDKPLEEDFSLLYSFLVLPFRLLMTNPVSMGSTTVDTARELSCLHGYASMWSKLYTTFHQIAALKVTVPNAIVEGVCSRILILISQTGESEDVTAQMAIRLQDSLVDCMLGIVESVEFVKKKMENRNLESLTKVTLRLLRCVHTSITLDRVATAQQLITMVINLFKKAQNPGHIFIIFDLSSGLTLWLGEAKNPDISAGLKKLVDSLWDELISCLKRCYKGPFNSEFLAQMSELLKAGFCNKHRHIKNSAVEFWNTTFGETESLDYPANLTETLLSLKKKTQISMPGWKDPQEKKANPSLENSMPVEDPSLAVDFQLLQGTRYKPKNTSSPKKEETKKRKADTNSPTIKARKLDDEFVAIPAPANPQPMVLTDRQKEKMKERPQVPVTYTGMDQSQDPAALFMDDDSSHTHRNKPKEAVRSPDPKASKTSITSLLWGNERQEPVIAEKPIPVDIYEKLSTTEALLQKLSAKELIDVQQQLCKLLETCTKTLKYKI